jgi:hypothetical protein
VRLAMARAVGECILFVGDLKRWDIDDEEVLELFRTEHSRGVSGAQRYYSQENWAIKRSRERAYEAYTNAGGHGTASVKASLGW